MGKISAVSFDKTPIMLIVTVKVEVIYTKSERVVTFTEEVEVNDFLLHIYKM